MELKQTRLNDSKQDNTSAVLSQGLSASALRAPRLKRASGFTLIEVMVVIVILGVLAALIVPNVMGRGEKAKVDTTQITLKGVAGALDQFKLDNGHFPTMQEGGLDALVNQPATAKNWLPGGYVKGGYPKDSWDNDLQYVIPGTEDVPTIYILLVPMVKPVAKEMMLIFIMLKNN